MRDVTGEEVKKAVLEKDISSINHHDCCICGFMVKYLVVEGRLFFDPSCNCSSGGGPEPCDWEEAAKWINVQSNPEIKKKLAARFGIEL